MTKKESVNFWTVPQLANLELLHATYVQQNFSKHFHDGFAFGVIEQGALRFSYHGESLVAASGCINLANPGEAHDGFAATEAGWTYRMFYLQPKLLEQAVYDLSGKINTLPFFAAGVIEDPYLAMFIRKFHFLLEKSALTFLEQDSLLLIMLTEFISRYGRETVPVRRLGKEMPRIRLVREYIEENYQRNFSLQELASLVQISPFYLIRLFKAAIGLPPHLYLKQVRIRRAKELLASGLSLASIAQAMGFTDQSHFSRQFKELMGITPKNYSKIIQEKSPGLFTIK
ncbi:MAG: AraC family transcriptional regulator [Sporomusaceae bacterium]|nr:AraC family transcriptional regulator [Sporomusaceae bacterium]